MLDSMSSGTTKAPFLSRSDLSLTTPVLRDADSVFPGENWFFYWKTSASLWKSKIEEQASGSRLFVPINWAFHSDTGDSCDFAQNKPETDLAKLVRQAKELGKMVIFLVPVTPAPFLINGGLPHLLARSVASNEFGLNQCVLDPDEGINKMYSFFDTRVFKAYSRFVGELGRYFSENGIDSDVFGLRSCYVNEEGVQSFMLDRSSTYEQAFSRFLEAKRQDEKSGLTPISPEDEARYHQDFFETISDVYCQEAEAALSGNWEGVASVGFLGARPDEFFDRLENVENQSEYCRSVMDIICSEVLPSSVLLPARSKRGILQKELDDLVSNSYSHIALKSSFLDSDNDLEFKPLCFFEVYDIQDAGSDAPIWADLGLWEFLQDKYQWTYIDKDKAKFKWDETIEHEGKIYFFQGKNIDQSLYHNLLKLFMSGGKIIINRSGMDPVFLKKFETFFLENSLEVEKVNYVANIHSVSLGDSKMIIFEGDKLTDVDETKCFDFWSRLMENFPVNHLILDRMDGVEVFWRKRQSSHSELNYEEIRKMGVYNPSSYKRKINIPVPRNFAVIKVVDEVNAAVQTFQGGIQIEMQPESSVSIEFGVFS